MDLSLPPELAARRPVLAYSPHPLMAASERELVYAEFLPRETLEAYLRRNGILARMGRQPFVLTLDGRRLPRELWRLTRPRPGTLINLYAAVKGGGGGGKKNPVATVAMIAVMIYAPQLAAGLNGFGGLATVAAGGGLTGVGLGISAGIAVVGGLAVNAIFPPPKPQLAAAQKLGSESPTYAIQGGGNRMRRYEPMMKICGSHRVLPDFGAQTYSEFEGEDQWGYYVFNYGYNDLVLSEHKIGDTPLASFSASDYVLEESGPSGALTLFPGNVDSLAGGALVYGAPGPQIVRTSSPDATALAVEITGLLFAVNNEGAIVNAGAAIVIQYRAVGSPDWLPFAAGAPGWNVITNGTRKPVRKTYWRQVPQGQYEIAVQIGSGDSGAAITMDLAWSQLRSYQPDTADYTGQKRLALKIRASALASGSLQQFSSLASARCQSWNGAAWVQAETSNPAWWCLDAARGKTVAGRRVFGGGLADGRIDIEGLKAFGAWCDAEGLKFDGVFDQQISVFDLYAAIALMGRATPSWGTGKFGVVWDAPNQNWTAVFGMHNILPGSFEIDYATEELAEVIEGWFINKNRDWQRDFVRVNVPGASGSARVRRIELFGRTDETLAAQDTNLYAAQNAYRSRRYKWRSDWEAMPASRGDVVLLSHDLASLDYSGRFVEGGDAQTLKLPRKVPLYAGGAFIVIVKPDGSFATYGVQGGAGETDTLTLTAPLAFNPWADANHPPYDYRWLYGPTSTPGKKVKITAFKPISERVVEVHAMDERPEFYTAKSNPYSYTPPATIFGGAPTVSNLVFAVEGIRAGEGYLVSVTATWDASGNYSLADVRLSVNSGPYRAIGQDIRRTSIDFLVEDFSNVALEITAYGNLGRLGKAAVLTGSKSIDFASLASPADVSGLSAGTIATGIQLTWAKAPDVDVTDYELRLGADWAAGAQVFRGRALKHVDTPKLAGVYTYWAKALDSAKQESVNAVQAQVTVNAIGAPAVDAAIEETDVILTWSAPALQFAADTYEVRHGADFASGTSLGKTKSTTLKVPIDWIGARTFWVAVTDLAGQTGAAGGKIVTITAAAAPMVTAAIAGENVVLSWTAPASTLPIREYEIRYGASYAAGTRVARIKGTAYTEKVSWAGSRSFWVAAYDSNENPGAAGNCEVSITAPSAPVITQQVIDNNVLLKWTDATQTLPIKHYEIRRGATFAAATVIGTVGARFSVLFEDSAGSYTYWVVGVDSAGNYGTEQAVAATVAQPPDFVFFDRQESQMDSVARSNWLRTRGDNYVLELDGATQYGQHASSAFDRADGQELSVEIWLKPGRTAGQYQDAIGNRNAVADFNWFLYQHATDGALSFHGALQYKSTYVPNVGEWIHACATVTAAGQCTIYVNGSIVYGPAAYNYNASTPGVLRVGWAAGGWFLGDVGPARIYTRALSAAEVVEHYHGIFKNEANILGAWDFEEGAGTTAFDDTDNAFDLQLFSDPVWKLSTLDGRYDLTAGAPKAYFPVYADESVSEYIARTGYNSPQDAITAGYLHPLTPAPAAAQYSEVIDYGTVIPSTKVSIMLTNAAFLGNVTITPKISVKELAGDPWTDYPGVWSVYVTNFRYAKITLDVAGAGGNNLAEASQVNIKLDVKLKNDAGEAACAAGDAGGTVVEFNVEFGDVYSITVTPKSTTPVAATYDFVDTPNPTQFKILLFDPATGNRVSGPAGWSAKGV